MALRVHRDVECTAGAVGRARVAFGVGAARKYGRWHLDRHDMVGEPAEVAGHGQHAVPDTGRREVAADARHDDALRQADRQRLRPSHAGPIRGTGARIGLARLSDVGRERCCRDRTRCSSTLSRGAQEERCSGLPVRRLSEPQRLHRPFHRGLQEERSARHAWRDMVRLHGDVPIRGVTDASAIGGRCPSRVRRADRCHGERAFRHPGHDANDLTGVHQEVDGDVFHRPGRLPCRRNGER